MRVPKGDAFGRSISDVCALRCHLYPTYTNGRYSVVSPRIIAKSVGSPVPRNLANHETAEKGGDWKSGPCKRASQCLTELPDTRHRLHQPAPSGVRVRLAVANEGPPAMRPGTSTLQRIPRATGNARGHVILRQFRSLACSPDLATPEPPRHALRNSSQLDHLAEASFSAWSHRPCPLQPELRRVTPVLKFGPIAANTVSSPQTETPGRAVQGEAS
ncbi:hypothetical protein DL770_004798 [Monosporascus sp. CRB-9-2]|nr:hypothetical protein DL770_004798 [Monosporascus sp. CRB-9-2]